MAFHILAEAVLRIEHKIDALLRHLKIPAPAPMHFTGTTCPACGTGIEYQVDLQHNVVVRKCLCKTGKFISTIPLFPGPVNSKKGVLPDGNDGEGSTEDSPERKAHRSGNR